MANTIRHRPQTADSSPRHLGFINTLKPAVSLAPAPRVPSNVDSWARTALDIAGLLPLWSMVSEMPRLGLPSVRVIAGVPKRLPVLWAKLAVLGSAVFTVSLAASFAAFIAGQAILGTDGASISDTGVLRAVVGNAVYLAGASAIGLALGALMRSTAAAITTLVGGLFVLPTVSMLLLPASWADKITPYLPSSAGDAFSAVTQSADRLSPSAGLAVFAGYLALVVAAGAWRLKTRDA